MVQNPITNIETITMKNKNIYLYPNPSSGIINLVNVGEPISGFKIYNSMGQEIIITPNNSSKDHIKIDLSGYDPGLYYIDIQTPKDRTTKSIVIF